METVVAVALPDDWRTQGDWYGIDKWHDFRYGEWHAHLCAVSSPFDSTWGRKGVAMAGRLGLNKTKDDGLRHWIHWEKTDNPRTHKVSYQGYRRQAEWDDYGEAYPLTHEGPHLYITVIVPVGTVYLVLYFFNKDGHEGNNRWRDYLITIKHDSDPEADFARNRVLARGRVCHFWGGVYKVFAVQGGQTYTIQIHDNWSFNTIVSGVFVDPILATEKDQVRTAMVSRMRHGLRPDEWESLPGLAMKHPESRAHQAAGIVGLLQLVRTKQPLTFAELGRPTALPALRALLAESRSDIPAEQQDRIRAEYFHHLKLFDRRDGVYAILHRK
jgi:hypothetical protein